MIDIHAHILPGIDDGAQDIYDTLEMVHLAARSGAAAMVATPHCNIPGGYKNYRNDEYREVLQYVQKAVKKEGLPVRILSGAEAYVTSDLPKLVAEKKIMTLNESRYLLIEFAFNEDPEYAEFITDEVHKQGVIPVIAHPERYDFVQEVPQIVYRWRKKGYPIQMNKGSLQGRFGRKAQKIGYRLLNHHLVSVIASDAHSPYQRTPYMGDVYERLLADYPEEYLQMLFTENPKRICKNEPILSLRAKILE